MNKGLSLKTGSKGLKPTVRCTFRASVIKRISPLSSDGVPLDLQMGPLNTFSELFEEFGKASLKVNVRICTCAKLSIK